MNKEYYEFVEKVLSTDIDELDIRKRAPTNKYVLTGGPCCGKTTLAEGLEKKGFVIAPEMARMIIDYETETGGDALPWANRQKFQEAVIKGQILQEYSLPENKTVILDRGMMDNKAYFIHDGTEINEKYNKIFELFGSYEKVLVLNPVPYVNDGARKEDEKEAKKLHSLFRDTYESMGNIVEEIPVFDSVDERVDYVSKIIESYKR